MESFDHILDMLETGSSLHAAVYEGDTSLVSNLLNNGKTEVNEKDKHGRTALHYAACRGQFEIVEMLLEKSANVNIKDKNGNIPLHWCGHVDVIELLIRHGSKVDARNCGGATPKDMAERRGVSNTVIKVFEEHQVKEDQSHVKTLFHEFSDEMGIKNLILLILVLILISVYVAYTITGFSSHLSRSHPIVLH